MNIEDLLLDISKAERLGGSIAQQAFSYQKNWTISKLLELHQNGQEYVIVCEHGEDVIIIDSKTSPSKVSFYQIKTRKDAKLTLSFLLKVNDSKKAASILGKLYSKGMKASRGVESFNIVSNASFDIKTSDGTNASEYKQFKLSKCSREDLDKLNQSLQKELGLEKPLGWEDITFFHVSDISYNDPETSVRGIISIFFEKEFPERMYLVSPFYKALSGEIEKKNKFASHFNDFNNLVQEKGISRDDFQNMLDVAKMGESFEEKWNLIESFLKGEGLSAQSLWVLRESYRKYEIDCMDPTNESLNNMRKEVSTAMQKKKNNFKGRSLLGIKDLTRKELGRDFREKFSMFEDSYIQAVIFDIYITKSYETKR